MPLRRPARHRQRALALVAAACLLLAAPPCGTAADARAAPRAAHAPALPRDTTPLPTAVRDAGAGRAVPHGGAAASTGSGSGSSSAGAFVRMFGGLAVVLAVIYGVYWLLKTYGRAKRGDAQDERMTVLGTTTLAANRALHLVRVGDEIVLVGSGEQTVTPIRTWDANELRRAGIDVDSPQQPARGVRRGRGHGGRNGRNGSGRPDPAPLIDGLRRWTAR